MCCLFTSIPSLAANLEVKIAEDKPYTLVNHGEDLVKVQRIQDTSNTLEGALQRHHGHARRFVLIR
jgi:hypothetical protein